MYIGSSNFLVSQAMQVGIKQLGKKHNPLFCIQQKAKRQNKIRKANLSKLLLKMQKSKGLNMQ